MIAGFCLVKFIKNNNKNNNIFIESSRVSIALQHCTNSSLNIYTGKTRTS